MIHSHIVRQVIRLFMLYVFLTLFCNLAYAQPPYSNCSGTSNYEGNITLFQNNLQDVLLSLPSNASVSKFYNTSKGNDPDGVYSLYMCLNYVTNETCQTCITTATKDILDRCSNTTEAVVWEEVCQMRFSNKNFFGQLNIAGNYIGLDNKQKIAEPELFKSVVNEILNNLTKRAAFNLSANMYATGEVPFQDKTIYALVQCTRDLSADGCNSCLQGAITDVLTCCYFSVGARLPSRSCYLRYELYNFYNGSGASSSTNEQGGSSGWTTWMMVILAVVSACLVIVLLGSCIFCLMMRKKAKKGEREIIISQQANVSNFQHTNFQGRYDPNAQESPHIDLASLLAATNNFSDSNKLGEGGFGPVYKGILCDGKEVAVKRLSYCSEQGTEEFTNEVLLIMKLQHKNLVRLLGFCTEREEKLLVYEFMPNSSLDVFLFDPRRRAQLNWSRRLIIISGIARGILYLHEDSRLRIIHRDLKASNILLDYDMNPKISDFGMARIFTGNEGEANTAKIVGTYGYMAPEYAMEGLYSIKSDVFSFGVLLLEIITGRRNAGFHWSKRAPSLLAYAWQLWNEGKAIEMMHPLLNDSCYPDEFLKNIHIGLLCVQEDANDRPTMSSVVVMLKNESITLSQPQRPAFSVGRFTDHYETSHDSINGLSVSNIGPR
ncbi:cysteine-rich receptor-like protein kinase 10 [Corylus avellana]|uniref:cysteine-rich receptor-like protein kinase 10 n=1 Tax=Corylus avellana TaxID=13451 RepID=UPI00286B3F5F|nr:cysteine-rich receptor-like protein kinase 10 [Corylus avellana]